MDDAGEQRVLEHSVVVAWCQLVGDARGASGLVPAERRGHGVGRRAAVDGRRRRRAVSTGRSTRTTAGRPRRRQVVVHHPAARRHDARYIYTPSTAESPNSLLDMHTHAGSAFDNHVTLTFDLLTL